MKRKTKKQVAKIAAGARWAGRTKMLEDLSKVYDSMMINKISRWKESQIEVLWKIVIKN